MTEMPDVVVYTKPRCPQCDATKRKLDQLDIEYTTVDISLDDEAREYVLSLGYQQAPVVVFGDNHWSGYSPDRLAKLDEYFDQVHQQIVTNLEAHASASV